MKIGIFGGSFNPPHKMHVDIAKYILENKYLDKIIFVPTGIHYKYKSNLAPDEQRLQMLNLALEGLDNISVSDYEQQGKLMYTCDTLEHFQKVYPSDQIYFICGADNLSYIETWKNAVYLLEHYRILVVRRGQDDLESILARLGPYQKNIEVLNMDLNGLSSTIIRDKIKNGESIGEEYLNPKVLKFIRKNKMYKN